MKEWQGQSCKIQIIKDGVKLFYTVRRVVSVSDHDITFLDKFNNLYTYDRDLVVEIKPLEAQN